MKEFLIFNIIYKWKYLLAIVKSKFYKNQKSKKTNSILYIAREHDSSWIFGAKVRRLAKYSPVKSEAYFDNKLRGISENFDGYYFIFPQYFCRAVRHHPFLLRKKCIVMFTHENWTTSYSKTHIIWCLNKADAVICLNSEIKNTLISYGLKPEKIHVLHIASDPNFFKPQIRDKGTVGFCSAYDKRKNPKLIVDIIKNTPDRHFYMIGQRWENYPPFVELLENATNLTYYKNEEYSKYPELYHKIDIFISASLNEGGPVPVLEAMLSNCYPILSKTGFCPDVVTHNENGLLFDLDADYKEVKKLINIADQRRDIDIRETVMKHSWENCSKEIHKIFNSK